VRKRNEGAPHGKPVNNLPRNFHWDWQRWIQEDLLDSVLLKYGWFDRDFSSRGAARAAFPART
jgi:hypothetical protein